MVEGVSSILKALTGLGQVVLLGVVTAFFLLNWNFFRQWLVTMTHLEFLGLKFDRVAAEEKFAEIKKKGDLPFAEAALVRAARVLPALNGARILWVDAHPENNRLERGILEDLGMHVQVSLSPEDALELVKHEQPRNFDVVISSVRFDDKSRPPLRCCQVHFYDFPSAYTREHSKNDLAEFNKVSNTSPQGGFALADQLANDYPQLIGNYQRSRIIFYTGGAAGVVTVRCARAVTNQADVLLHSVISVLEELRWERLRQASNTTTGKWIPR